MTTALLPRRAAALVALLAALVLWVPACSGPPSRLDEKFRHSISETFEEPPSVVVDLVAVRTAGAVVVRAVGQGAPWQLAQRPETLDLLHDGGLVFALSGTVARRDDGGVTWLTLDGEAGAPLGCALLSLIKQQALSLTYHAPPSRCSKEIGEFA